MISKSFGLLFYLKKLKGQSQDECPIYLRITIDGIVKEISIQRKWDPGRWDARTGRPIVPKTKINTDCQDDPGLAINAFLDTLLAKVHEARHTLIMSGKPVTAESVKNLLQGKKDAHERPRMLLEIFQHHNDQVKALIGKEYSKGTLTKFATILKHTHAFLKWKYKAADIDICKLDYEFVTDLEFWYKSVQKCDHNTTMKIYRLRKKNCHTMHTKWLASKGSVHRV